MHNTCLIQSLSQVHIAIIWSSFHECRTKDNILVITGKITLKNVCIRTCTVLVFTARYILACNFQWIESVLMAQHQFLSMVKGRTTLCHAEVKGSAKVTIWNCHPWCTVNVHSCNRKMKPSPFVKLHSAELSIMVASFQVSHTYLKFLREK